MPNRAPAVELVIGQSQYRQPSVVSPPYIRQRGRLGGTNVQNLPGQSPSALLHDHQ